ncbi:MAG: transcription elongation factor [Acidobacteriota bacterium]|nr:transcription elongation factor [Acidobacteriota bacterium]
MFTRDTIQGSVYLEVSTLDNIQSILGGVSGIIRSGRVPRMDLIPLDERAPLLDMKMTGMDPQLGFWVRLRCSGRHRRYRNDLALVTEFDSLKHPALVTVYVVPRIHMLDRKRKRHSELIPAGLFHPETVKSIYGADSVERRNAVYVFKGDIFRNGLLELEVDPTDISCGNVLATPMELDVFRRSGDDLVIKALDAGVVVPLQYGDRIQAIAGTFKGLIGHVLEISDNSTVIFQSVDAGQSGEKDMPKKASRFQVCLSEVQKKFELGDRVQVLQGEFRGEEGYIVEINGEKATVYKRHLVLSEKYGTHEDFGTEVSIEFA